jgi:hypothetical protein
VGEVLDGIEYEKDCGGQKKKWRARAKFEVLGAL